MPPRIVIDTNVIYAALRSNRGASFRILEAVWAGKVIILLSQTVLMEYEEILKQYAPSLRLNDADVDTVLDLLCAVCQKFELNTPWSPVLQDPDDEAFVRLSVAGRADGLITHNLRHFAPARSLGINVLAPRQFLASITL
jgi:putative PIN family toxin of toxin-antitoxin system